MASKNEIAAQIMEHLCTHSNHGYSQGSARYGNGTKETIIISGNKYVIAGGDRDCSSAIIDAWDTAGVPVKSKGASYTGNMKKAFLATGQFVWKPMSFIAQRGDVYLNEANHTAMCVSTVPDKLAEFSISENGTIYGKTGDQTGRESYIHAYYDYPWDGILHYIGTESKEIPSKKPTKTNVDIKLRAQTVDGTILEWTKYPDYAGWKECGAIAYLCVDCAWPIDVQVFAGGRWLPLLRNPKDIYNKNTGCAGNGSPITAVRLYLHSPNEDKVVKYQVATNRGYYPIQRDNETSNGQDGYAGDLINPIYEIKAWIGDY